MVKNKKLVIFLHIPKTAGTTIREILYRQFGRKNVFNTSWQPEARLASVRPFGIYVGKFRDFGNIWYPEEPSEIASRFNSFQQENTQSIDAIYGFHCEFGLDQFLSQPCESFAFLREPVSRVLSHYFFTLDKKDNTDCVQHYEEIQKKIEGNLQTKLLSGPHGEGPLPSPEKLLISAKSNLKSLAVIGLTERFDESLLLLKDVFGWRSLFYVSKFVNRKRPNKETLPSELIERIKTDNSLDIFLYAFAQELFEKQIQTYGASLAKRVFLFRILNTLWGQWQTLKSHFGKGFLSIYQALSAWGIFRHLIPAKLRPQAFKTIHDGKLNLSVRMGKSLVGEYVFSKSHWQIKEPLGLFVNTDTLFGQCQGLKAIQILRDGSRVFSRTHTRKLSREPAACEGGTLLVLLRAPG